MNYTLANYTLLEVCVKSSLPLAMCSRPTKQPYELIQLAHLQGQSSFRLIMLVFLTAVTGINTKYATF